MKLFCGEIKGKRIILNIIFSLATFIFFVSILEIILRETHLFGARLSFTCPDPLLGYSFLPGRTYWVKQENDHPIIGRINHYGWKDNEWSLERLQNTYRIAVLGDSFVESFQVEKQYSFLALVEDQLRRESGIAVELMNFGRSGYTQAEEFLVLTNYVGEFSPDMVILFFFPGNDITDISKETAPDSMRPFYDLSKRGELILDTSFSKTKEFWVRSFINYFKQRSALISLIADRYVLYKSEKGMRIQTRSATEGEGQLARKLPGYLSLCTSHPSEVYVRNYQLNKILIRAMAEYCKKKNIQFMLICCDVYFAPEIENYYRKNAPTLNTNFFENDLKTFAESIGVEFLGLQSLFGISCNKKNISCHWGKEGHWNYAGHRLVGSALVSKLNLLLHKSMLGNSERGSMIK